MITGLYAALIGVFIIYLSVRVIALRRKYNLSIGSAQSPEIERAMRAQANCTEYTPIGLILLLILELNTLPPATIHGLGALFLLARLVHFFGFKSPSSSGALRVMGTATTFALIAIMAIIAAYHASVSIFQYS